MLREVTLPPSTEHIPPFDGWLMARVAEGVAYWLQHDKPASQLEAGDVLVVPRLGDGRLRASQLDPVKLQYFSVQPRQLDGLLSVVEWHHIDLECQKPALPVRFFSSTDFISQKFTRLTNLSHIEKLPLRCALLQLWAAATGDLWAKEELSADAGNKVRARFWWLLSHMTRMELSSSLPSDMARQTNCSERHFRTLFRQEFGMSIHNYQSALRLDHEREMSGETPPETSPVDYGRRAHQNRRFPLAGTKTNSGRAQGSNGKQNNTAPRSPYRERNVIRKKAERKAK